MIDGNLCTTGNLPKTIIKINGVDCLVKGNSYGNHEAISEVLVSNLIYSIDVNINHIRYELGKSEDFIQADKIREFGKYVSICNLIEFENVIEKQTLWDYICLNYGVSEENYSSDILEGIIETLPEYMKSEVYKTLWIDAIVANDDRHLGNFEFHYIKDKGLKIFPMFDFGRSLWYNFCKPDKWFRDKSSPIRSNHREQIKLISKYSKFNLNSSADSILHKWIDCSSYILNLLDEEHCEAIISGVKDRLNFFGNYKCSCTESEIRYFESFKDSIL